MRSAVIVSVVLVVLGALGGGFYLLGPPAEQRARTFDARREMDLQRLRLAADLYWTRNKRLPVSLAELATEAGTNIYALDPETDAPYTYVVKGPDAYEPPGSGAISGLTVPAGSAIRSAPGKYGRREK